VAVCPPEVRGVRAVSKRKNRPKRGELVTDDMSMRDKASALGISTGQMYRWMRLSQIPRDEFEARLARQTEKWANGGARVTTESILRGAPVPARGRVERALGLIRAMTDSELIEFLPRLTALLETRR